MTTTTPYTEVAAADGAWSCRVASPATAFESVCAVLADLTVFTGTPITAFLYGADGDPVTEGLLVRDPSRTHGTPDIPLYESFAQHLTAKTGWLLAPTPAPRTAILVGLGLREGYSPQAPQHSIAEVEHHLADHHTDWTYRPARLVSARLLDAVVRWYDEVGVVLQAPAGSAPVVRQLAAAFAQHRYVITDFSTDSTHALAALDAHQQGQL